MQQQQHPVALYGKSRSKTRTLITKRASLSQSIATLMYFLPHDIMKGMLWVRGSSKKYRYFPCNVRLRTI